MKKKILFIYRRDLTERDIDRYGFNIFFENDWEIETWIFKKEPKNVIDLNKKLKNGNIKITYINNAITFFIRYFSIKGNLFFYSTFISILKPFVELSFLIKGGIKIKAESHYSPTHFILEKNEGYLSQNKAIFFDLFKDKVIYSIINFLTPNPKILILSAKLSNELFKYSKSYKIFAHNKDYDQYLINKERRNVKASNKIIFLDQCLGTHPDFNLHQKEFPVDNLKYWNSMKLFFDYLEEKTNQNIVTCPHPAGIYRHPNIRYSQKDTSEEIVDASCVLGHDSMSLIHAVLWKKPVMLLTTDELIKSRNTTSIKQFKRIKAWSKALGSEIINIDDYNKDNFTLNNEYDEGKYDLFYKNYIKKNSNQKLYWNIVIEEIEKNFG